MNLLTLLQLRFYEEERGGATSSDLASEVSGSPPSFDPKTIVFVLYETLPESKFTTSLQAFLRTARSLSGVDAVVVGSNSEFKGYGSKYAAIRETLLKLLERNDDALVMLMDARDVVLNIAVDQKTEALEDFEPRLAQYIHRYSELTNHNPGSIVVSAEVQCCVAAMCWAHPAAYFSEATGKREQRACNSNAICARCATQGLSLCAN